MLKIRKSNFITRILSFSFNLKSVKSSSPLHLTFAKCFYLSLSRPFSLAVFRYFWISLCLSHLLSYAFLGLFMPSLSLSLSHLLSFRSLQVFLEFFMPFPLALFQVSLCLFSLSLCRPFSLALFRSFFLIVGLFRPLQAFLASLLRLFRPLYAFLSIYRYSSFRSLYSLSSSTSYTNHMTSYYNNHQTFVHSFASFGLIVFSFSEITSFVL